MSGYFRVSLAASQSIIKSSRDPNLLAAYIILCRFTYNEDHDLTIAGAKSIRIYAGLTDYRSKIVLKQLLNTDFDGRRLITAAGWKKKGRDVYRIEPTDDAEAYLPTLFVDKTLVRFCSESLDEGTARDALMMMLSLYFHTDYGGWLSAPPNEFVYQVWDIDGIRSGSRFDIELGLKDGLGEYDLWAVAPPSDDAWLAPTGFAEKVFGEGGGLKSDEAWQAVWCLLDIGVVCKVSVVQSGSDVYPLWVHSAEYRSGLEEKHGVQGNLAQQLHYLAIDADADPDHRVMEEAAAGELDGGTGVYFCISDSTPLPYTLLAPRLHAPTPGNLDGLREMSIVTRKWGRKISKLRRHTQ